MIEKLKEAWRTGSLQAGIGVSLCIVFGLGLAMKLGELLTMVPLWGFAVMVGFGVLFLVHGEKRQRENTDGLL